MYLRGSYMYNVNLFGVPMGNKWRINAYIYTNLLKPKIFMTLILRAVS